MKRHKHAKLLETIVHHIQLSKDTIHFKVKAHAGILGNRWADAIAKCSAENRSGHDIQIYTDRPFPFIHFLATSKGGKPSPSLSTRYF